MNNDPHRTSTIDKLKRAVPAVVLGLGATACSAESVSAESTNKVSESAQFGGSEDGWGQGTAEDLIKTTVLETTANAYAKMSMSGDEMPSPKEIREIVEDLPVKDQATTALEMANYDEVLPDHGDILTVDLDVTADSEGNVTYEVVDATIKDVANTGQ